jgi:tetratricopeptide (TPR) repeat protein
MRLRYRRAAKRQPGERTLCVGAAALVKGIAHLHSPGEERTVADRGDDRPPGTPTPLPSTRSGSWRVEGPTFPPPLTVAWSALLGSLDDNPWPAGHVLLDEFAVEGVLGQGGMGVVYRVRQSSTGQVLAVKRARLGDPGTRRRFLSELQLWIDLPAHPHLAACRFFRTIADEVVIFMDLADGGSLADRISAGRLSRLTDVLDVAIQVGQGLHALHEGGLVHQDVKPANVLMTADGTARVADFGLARARASLLQAPPGADGQSILFSSGAMTPAYCSPEQAARLPVSRRTDIWSWGVLVLEMFVGRVPCCERGGPFAAEVLEAHLGAPEGASPVERMSGDVAEVLRTCLREDPNERWASLGDAVEMLVECYRDAVGQAYPRPLAPRREAAPAAARRAALRSGRWDPPRKWLALAFREAGRDPTEVEAHLPPPAACARAQAVADLATYDDARVLLQQLVDAGRAELAPRLPELCVQKALVHLASGDSPGALELFDQAIADWQLLIHGQRRHELTPHLVSAYLHKASAHRVLGDNEEAVSLCDRVIALWKSLGNRRARRELRDDLASANLQKGLALRNLGRVREATELFDLALSLWLALVEGEGQEEPANDLAQAYLSKANALAAMGRPAEALDLCDRAITIRRRLARDGEPEAEAELGRALASKGSVLRGNDRARDALALYEQAIARWQRLVNELGRDDFAHELARTYLSRANAARSLGEARAAAEGCATAAAIWERLVHQEGRGELALHLARAYQHQSNALRVCAEPGEALRCADLGISLWERLVLVEQRQDLGNDLARSYVGKAQVLRTLGRIEPALEMYDRAIALRRRLVESTAREDIEGDLARDGVNRAELILESGDRERGKTDLATAVGCLEDVVRRTRRKDLDGALARARRLLRELEEPPGEIA